MGREKKRSTGDREDPQRLEHEDTRAGNRGYEGGGELPGEGPSTESIPLLGVLRYCIYCEPVAPGGIYPGNMGIGTWCNDRFNRGGERGLWTRILLELQKKEGIRFNEVLIDSTTKKVHGREGE